MGVSDSCPCAAGQLTFCIGEGLEPSVAPFQNLQDCRQECFPLGSIGSSGLLADNGCEEAGAACKALLSSRGVQMGISPAWSLCQKTCSQATAT